MWRAVAGGGLGDNMPVPPPWKSSDPDGQADATRPPSGGAAWRPLQPTGRPGEVWLATWDRHAAVSRLGRLDTRTQRFTVTNELSGLELDSAAMWVDETEGKVYAVHRGALVRAPIHRPHRAR